MVHRVRTWSAALLLALAVLFVPTGAQAAENVRPSCHAHADSMAAMPSPQSTAGWTCSATGFDHSRQHNFLLFTAADLADAGDVTHLVTRISQFDTLSLIVLDADGTQRRSVYRMEDVHEFVNGPQFAIALPRISDAQSLVVAIERPWNAAILSDATLQGARSQSLGWDAGVMLVIALFLGLLASPLIYNYAFYRVLREKFVLWHMAIVIGMMIYVLVSSGLIHHVTNLGIATLAVLHPIAFLIPVVAAAPFCLTYLEESALSPRMRAIVKWTAFGTAVVVGLMSFPIPFLRSWSNDLYYFGYLPLIAVFVAAMYQAARNNSRAVWFQIAAWIPMIAIGLERIPRGIGLYAGPEWLDQLMYLGIALEILVTAMGVVDRFDILRRDRDRVNARLDMLSSLVDRDALTGIYNRRALEERFAELRATGFTALAVVDLDHFKRINDRFGHQMGDRVLQEVASVLASDDDGVAFRMGGEEFLILLRGQNVAQRAEQLRRAISIRVANEVEGMEGPVTASMGLVDSPPGAAMTLRRLYAQADRLLYEAKNSGRNRMMSERIQLFDAPKPDGDRREAERRDEEDRRVDDRRISAEA